MKKLIYPENAKTPFWLADLEYMQSGIEEALKGIIEGFNFGRTCLIISGCKITQATNKISMTSGWAYYKGEILQVGALPETIIDESSSVLLEPRDPVAHDDGRYADNEDGATLVNVWYDRYLVPIVQADSEVPLNSAFIISEGAWDLGERISRWNSYKDTGWKYIYLSSASSKFTANSHVRYRQIGNMVCVKGNIEVTGKIEGGLTIEDAFPESVEPLEITLVAGTNYIEIDGKTLNFVMGSSMSRKEIPLTMYMSEPTFKRDCEGDGHVIIERDTKSL